MRAKQQCECDNNNRLRAREKDREIDRRNKEEQEDEDEEEEVAIINYNYYMQLSQAKLGAVNSFQVIPAATASPADPLSTGQAHNPRDQCHNHGCDHDRKVVLWRAEEGTH